MSGLIIFPLLGGIPFAPFKAEPRARLNITVSTLSLLLCAVATTDWSEVYVVCEHDIRSYIWNFLAE